MQIQELQILTKLLGLSCSAVFITFLMQKDVTCNANIFEKNFTHRLDAVYTNSTIKSSIISTFRFADDITAACSHKI